jgi:cysteine synthase A
MPETMSLERRKLLLEYGAKLILTYGSRGMSGAWRVLKTSPRRRRSATSFLQQFNNPANPAIHEATTGPEVGTIRLVLSTS